MKRNFLVTCVGEYSGSGNGTGALMLLKDHEPHVIDLLDSSGLFLFEDLIFRVIRKLKLIVIYDGKGIKSVLHLPELSDTHDVLVDSEGIYCVCTGSNQIIKFDHLGRKREEINFPGEGDAWHINCLRKVNNELYCSAFGIFNFHREWATLDYSKTGIIYNVQTKEIVRSDLSAPHNPLFLDGKWMVCNSLDSSLLIFDNTKTIRVECGGFTRGLNYDEDYIYVGVSSKRKEGSKGVSKILFVDRRNYEIKETVLVPFPEIYDIVQIDDKQSKEIIENKNRFDLLKLLWQMDIEDLYSDRILKDRLSRKIDFGTLFKKILTKIRILLSEFKSSLTKPNQ